MVDLAQRGLELARLLLEAADPRLQCLQPLPAPIPRGHGSLLAHARRHW
ncbi:MAG: hypothetical protein U5K43_01325 [Halofilum sp. (in: g-proteobacteria)]|nr:hypothetical protein [Halofilum sp. (in: g-proteobacteria)]